MAKRKSATAKIEEPVEGAAPSPEDVFVEDDDVIVESPAPAEEPVPPTPPAAVLVGDEVWYINADGDRVQAYLLALENGLASLRLVTGFVLGGVPYHPNPVPGTWNRKTLSHFAQG